MIIILSIFSWLLCGFLAYGTMKGQWRDHSRRYKIAAYDKGDEFYCICAGVMGLIGLIISFTGSRLNGYRGFCLRMPKELRKKVKPD